MNAMYNFHQFSFHYLLYYFNQNFFFLFNDYFKKTNYK